MFYAKLKKELIRLEDEVYLQKQLNLKYLTMLCESDKATNDLLIDLLAKQKLIANLQDNLYTTELHNDPDLQGRI